MTILSEPIALEDRIKIVREPTVWVIGRQQIDQGELDRFLLKNGVRWESDSEIASEVLAETAGRLCYFSYARPRPGGNAAYLHHIKQSGHGSVLEHAVWNLLITGVSRSLTHELVRHRAGMGFSQLSQRYVDESIAEYVEPACIAADPELHKIWIKAIAASHQAYCQIAEKLGEQFAFESNLYNRQKLARQAARSVLPNATETKIFMTANARALRHFLEQRCSKHAEPEIRNLAYAIYQVLVKEAPNLFGDYEAADLPDGSKHLVTLYRKV